MIDIVIPTCDKDLETLEICIAHAKKYVKDAGQVYVVSEYNFTKNAKYVPETAFPFTLEGISQEYIKHFRAHWYYQQLLKLYAHKVIPGLSENFLILDSDTIFYQPVEFLDNHSRAMYCTSDEKSIAYNTHMVRLVPELVPWPNGMSEEYGGVVHHMLFNQTILNELFEKIEKTHGMDLWRAFLSLVDKKYIVAGASEYQIYFTYCFALHPDKVVLRPLRWDLSDTVLEESEFDYLTAHAHIRKRDRAMFDNFPRRM